MNTGWKCVSEDEVRKIWNRRDKKFVPPPVIKVGAPREPSDDEVDDVTLEAK